MSSTQQERPRGSLPQNNINQIEALFPNICHDYLAHIHAEQNYDLDAVVNRIFDETDRGQSYPRRPKTTDSTLKRKRVDEPDEPPSVGKALAINETVMADRRHIASLPSHIKTQIEKTYW
jgi:hypothetical protein